MLKISYTGFLGLSPAISAQFSLEMCVAVRNHEKFTKTPYFGGSGSFKVIDLDIPKKLVTSACYENDTISFFVLCWAVFRQVIPCWCITYHSGQLWCN